ncbi:MAG: DUF4920 domain-containing protein [Pyrinomonadaceae bacterium]
MKKIMILPLLVLGTVSFGFVVRSQEKPAVVHKEDGVVRRGQALAGAAFVSLDNLLKEPGAYQEKIVAVEGVVERSCTNKGCWMEIAPKAGEAGMRVTFKDYGFFVPLNSQGMKVKAEGQVAIKTLSRAQADHYEGEGARLTRNADGTAHEVTFIATGVELKKEIAR